MKHTRIVFLVLIACATMASTIDLNQLFDYEGLIHPNYITLDNTGTNTITNKGATLGRVLFYDKRLSANNTIACASCHKQAFAFGDTAVQSVGLNGGLTGRHSMRLVNARFSDERKFFWDERAATLEDQATMPIQDHIEMGFSGTNGDPDMDSLIHKLAETSFYPPLMELAFGDTVITEERMQEALAQFIRSIQSFDTKYDSGRAQVNGQGQNFPNFTAEENLGKRLFLRPLSMGGAGCAGCHRASDFGINPNSLNNNIIGVAGNPNGIDLTNTRSPSLRELFAPDGTQNGPFMHDGSLETLEEVIEHYNLITLNQANTNLDQRLAPGGQGQDLQLTQADKDNLLAFLKTLSGSYVYTAEEYSNPFDVNGNLAITPPTSTQFAFNEDVDLKLFPNPAQHYFQLDGLNHLAPALIYSIDGQKVWSGVVAPQKNIDVSFLKAGTYLVVVQSDEPVTLRLVKY